MPARRLPDLYLLSFGPVAVGYDGWSILLALEWLSGLCPTRWISMRLTHPMDHLFNRLKSFSSCAALGRHCHCGWNGYFQRHRLHITFHPQACFMQRPYYAHCLPMRAKAFTQEGLATPTFLIPSFPPCPCSLGFHGLLSPTLAVARGSHVAPRHAPVSALDETALVPGSRGPSCASFGTD